MRSKAVVCAILVFGMVVHAAQKNEPKKTSVNGNPGAQKTQEGAGQQGGVVVFVDPITRQIRQATPNDIGTLSPAPAAQAATTVQPAIIQGFGGAVGVVLGPEFQMHVVATKTADGKVQIEEVSGQKTGEARVSPRQ